MSAGLDAIADLVNACQPLPHVLTGGQPSAEHLQALKADCHLSVHQRQPRQLPGLGDAVIGRVAEDVLNAWGEQAQ